VRSLLRWFWLLGAWIALAVPCAHGADTLAWQPNRVDADINNCPLPQFLQKLASATGWKIYYEPVNGAVISIKFTGEPEEEALHRLLGKFNYAREITNGVTRLLVFQTVVAAATHPVTNFFKDYLIRNELLVKLKANSPITIEELAKQLHAKIVGRSDKIGLYRLQFEDEAAANAALQALSGNDAVAAVGHNYSVDPPNPSQFAPGTVPNGMATPNPAAMIDPKTPAQGGLVVGLIDTAIQPQPGYEKYMLNPISVVGQPDIPTTEPTHGTAMLETMVQAMSDNPSMIQPIVIYKNGEQTTTFELINGVVTAANMGANPISMSLGGTGDSDMLHSVIDAASQKGILFVAASGNTPGGSLTYPAAYNDVLSVTALGANGQLASYADNFPGVKTSAPGTSYIPWNGSIWVPQGTSTATAIVTGMITQNYNQLYSQSHTSLIPLANQWITLHPPPALH
jgi:hypothetical protein